MVLEWEALILVWGMANIVLLYYSAVSSCSVNVFSNITEEESKGK